jgi:ring-1,2-phenylacetyl-CoA epoxidase subunit PaaC
MTRGGVRGGGSVALARLLEYVLGLADDALILGHRLSEWSGQAPMLEEDIALSNLALDLIGQSRLLYAYAGEIEGKGTDEDAFAYLRDEHEFRNLMLVEQPNGDFAVTMVRQLFYAAFKHPFYEALRQSRDRRLADIAGKAVKEMAYHVRHAGEWVIRLGDGTEESRRRVAAALDDLWMYTGEMFEMDEGMEALVRAGIAADPATIRRRPLGAVGRPPRPPHGAPGPPAGRDAGPPPRASGRNVVGYANVRHDLASCANAFPPPCGEGLGVGVQGHAMANERARELHRNRTASERRLWWKLRELKVAGFRFRQQVPIDWYAADFAGLSKILIAEMDGGTHSTDAPRNGPRAELSDPHPHPLPARGRGDPRGVAWSTTTPACRRKWRRCIACIRERGNRVRQYGARPHLLHRRIPLPLAGRG